MTDPLTLALAALPRHAGSHERLLAALVEQNSFSGNQAGGNAVVTLLEEALALGALTSRRFSSERFADHVLFETAAAARGHHVLLLGHHDTVFAPGTFEGYRSDGSVARGPGVLDMKGGLVVVVAALRALDEVGALGDLPLRFLSVGDEEVGSPDSHPLIVEQAGGARAALDFESGREDDGVITRRKGTASRRIIAHGRPAHAGNAHADGANAIWALARFIDAAQDLTDYERGITVSVGVVRGGRAKNVVPDRAEALVDVRFLTRADGEALLGRLDELAARELVEGTHFEVEPLSLRAPLERTEASAALAQAYGACQELSGLGGGEHILVGGGSDASAAAAAGVPAIDGLGPRGVGFHTPDERIELHTLHRKTEALVRYLGSQLRAASG